MNKETRKGMSSSKSMEWFTPRHIYDKYNEIFHFTTDPCTSTANPLGWKVFYTIKDDGLVQPWYGNVWINPPYGRQVDDWVERGAEYAKSGKGVVVMLIAARTDTERFHKYIWDKSKSTWRDNVWGEFLESRIKFLSADGNEVDPAFFPSMVVIFFYTQPKQPNNTTRIRKRRRTPLTISHKADFDA